MGRVIMRIESDEALIALIRKLRRVAVLGISDKVDRPSNQVFRFWRERGVDAVPVNPKLASQEIEGCCVLPDLPSIAQPVDMVDVFRDSFFLPEITDQVIALDVPALWTQLGVTHAEAEKKALANGVSLVVNKCPAQEIPRLEKHGHVFDFVSQS